MTLIAADNLGKHYGGHVCFAGVSFTLPEGRRVGLIGPNGCGKTTFFKVIAGEEDHEGDLNRRRGLSIARLDQNPVFAAGATPRAAMAEAVAHWRELDGEIVRLQESLGGLSGREAEAGLRRLGHLEAMREAGGGESAMRRAETVLSGVGIRPGQLDQAVDSLSGGERCRVALARLLLNEPDVWLLDEPTNHLDLDGIAFLEKFLKNSPASAIVISHDRRFLDLVTEETWELEGGALFRYPGNYSRSRRVREERRLVQWREWMKQRDFLRKEQSFIAKWQAGTRSRQAQSRMKRLAKLDLADRPDRQSRLAALNLRLGRRLGDLALEIDDLAVGFDFRTLFSGLRLSLAPGEIVGIVGPNGAGKTSLFRTLLGEMKPLSGSFRWGPTAEVGFMDQREAFPDENRTPMQYLQDANLGEDDQDRRDRLGAMLFSGDDALKPIRVLSGGERKRLVLTRLLLEGHNVLVLDEPTNHLDIPGAEAVTLALSAYEGSVMVISHDRYFLDEAADRVLWLENGGWRIAKGGFTEAEGVRAELQTLAEAKGRKSNGGGRTAAAAADRPYASWRTGKLEERIIANEERIAGIHAAFLDPGVVKNGDAMRALQNELSRITGEQKGLEEEYARR